MQLLSDMTVIMTEIFLLEVDDPAVVEEIGEKYPTTPAFAFIQDKVCFERITYFFNVRDEFQQIMNEAVKLNTGAR